MKSYEVKMTIVNRTYVQLKTSKLLTAHRRDVGIANMCMTQITNFQMISNHLNGTNNKLK